MITSTIIKIIAMITMLIDHIGTAFYPDIQLFNLLGRMSFVLYAFLISEAVKHVKNKKKYLLRLLVIAFMSEIPYDLLFSNTPIDFTQQNVIFTLLTGSVCCFGLERFKSFNSRMTIIAVAMSLTIIFNCDYPIVGVLLITMFFFSNKPIHYISSVIVFAILRNLLFVVEYPISTLGYLLAIPLILLYSYQKPSAWFKYLFWSFYPLHMILLFICKQ